jgi:hypothetical protein
MMTKGKSMTDLRGRVRLIGSRLLLICVAFFVATLGAGWAEAKKDSARATVSAPLPDGLFLKEAPANPLGVKDAKQKSRQGETVVIHGRVGGRAVPFVEGRAVFLIVDPALPPSQDACGTPWDYCAVPPQTLMENLATVQILGSDGKPLKAEIRNVNGLEPLSEVIITGSVAKRDLNVFLVNAETIYVKPKDN